MKVTGQIKFIGQTQQVSDSFKKRELHLVTSEQYPQTILIEFAQEKCDLLNLFTPGMTVDIDINLRGREWVNPQGETKVFNTIQGWKISASGQPAQQPQGYPQQPLQGYQQQPQQGYGMPQAQPVYNNAAPAPNYSQHPQQAYAPIPVPNQPNPAQQHPAYQVNNIPEGQGDLPF